MTPIFVQVVHPVRPAFQGVCYLSREPELLRIKVREHDRLPVVNIITRILEV